MKVAYSSVASFSLGGSEVAAEGWLSVSLRCQTVEEDGGGRGIKKGM